MTHALTALAAAVAAVLLNALWEDALLVGAVWLLLRAWPRLNAATRYTMWGATLVAALAIPLATTVPFLAAPPPVVHRVGVAPEREAYAPHSAPMRAVSGMPSPERPAGSGALRETLPRVSSMRFPERFYLTLPAPLALAILLAWAALALAGLTRLLLGLRALEALKRDALPLPVAYRDAMARWLGARQGGRPVRLCVSDAIDVPVAVGLFDAMIVIPRALLDELDPAEIDAICLHELAHLRRADDWGNGIARALLALVAWHPAAHFAAQQLDLEREVACDDWVLAQIGAARSYAMTLTKMAENAAWPRSPIAAPGVFATRKQISLRIERLLGSGRNAATALAIVPAVAAVGMVAALGIAMALVAPSVAAASIASPPAPLARVSPAPVTAVRRLAGHAPDATQPAATPPPHVAAAPALAAAAVRVRASLPPHVAAARVLVAQVAPVPSAPPSPRAAPSPIPTRTIVIPGEHLHIPARTVTIPPVDVDVPGQTVAVPSQRYLDGIVRDSMRAALRSVDLSMHAQEGHWVHDPSSKPTANCSACDLSNVNWPGAHLSGARYSVTDFSNANLSNVDFRNARFKVVDFKHADLHGANFSGATFAYVNFSRADLTGVDFDGATLRGCNLQEADLTHVDLSKAHLIESALPPTPTPP